MEELLRCPFCGGEAIVISDHIEYEAVYAVLCKECEASVGLGIQEYGEYNPCYISVPSLIAAWNRRDTQNIGKKECCEQDGRCTFDE